MRAQRKKKHPAEPYSKAPKVPRSEESAMRSASDPFLPRELWNLISMKLPISALMRLSLCSRFFLAFIRPMLSCNFSHWNPRSRTASYFLNARFPSTLPGKLSKMIFTHITSLQISEHLTFLSKLQNFTRLRNLDFKCPYEVRVRSAILPSLTNLEDIRFRKTAINLKAEWSRFTCLASLTIGFSSPYGLGGDLTPAWGELPSSLRVLRCDNVELEHITHLTRLEKIIFSSADDWPDAEMTITLGWLETNFPRLMSVGLSLVSLDLDDFQELEDSFTRFTGLYLDFAHILGSCAILESLFPSLRSLELKGDSFRDVQKAADIHAFSSLTTLKFKARQWPCFTPPVSLRRLHPDVTVDTLSRLTNLEALYYCFGVIVPNIFPFLPALRRLRLECHNRFDPKCLSLLTSLQELELRVIDVESDDVISLDDLRKEVTSFIDSLINLPRLEVFQYDNTTYVPTELRAFLPLPSGAKSRKRLAARSSKNA